MMGIRSFLAALAAVLAIGGCGGGTNYAGVGNGGTGDVVGTANGFGSVIVDGSKYDDANAVVTREEDPTTSAPIANTDIKLGERVAVHYNGSVAQTVVVEPEVIGVVESVSAGSLTIAGQTVVEADASVAPTVYEGATTMSDIQVGDSIEVHGVRDASTQQIVATRIERRDPSAAVVVRVVGTITAIDAQAKTLNIGALLTVDYSGATLLPSGTTTLSVGERVAVWSDTAVSGGTLAAKVVRVKSPTFADGATVRIGGFVSSFNGDFTAPAFKIDGVAVSASGASFSNGSVNNLANGRLVRVSGTYTGGQIVASQVRFVLRQADEQVELTGAVTDFVSAASFRVRGVPVDASATTTVFAPSGTGADNLGNGMLVKIHGNVVGDAVVATEVDFQMGASGSGLTLLGKVQTYNSATGAFTLLGLPMQISAATQFYNIDGTAASSATFAVGDRLIVRGSFVNGVFNVAYVVYRGQLGTTGQIQFSGTISSVDPANDTFVVNGVIVSVPGGAVGNVKITDLKTGMTVEIAGTVSGGILQAASIVIDLPGGLAVARVLGYVTNYVSVNDFFVGGQRVNASLVPTGGWTGGSASNLADGAYLDVRGAVNSATGVLFATQIDFKTP